MIVEFTKGVEGYPVTNRTCKRLDMLLDKVLSEDIAIIPVFFVYQGEMNGESLIRINSLAVSYITALIKSENGAYVFRIDFTDKRSLVRTPDGQWFYKFTPN